MQREAKEWLGTVKALAGGALQALDARSFIIG